MIICKKEDEQLSTGGRYLNYEAQTHRHDAETYK